MNRWHIYNPAGEWENVIGGENAPDLPPGYTASLTPPEPSAAPAQPVQLTPREFMNRLSQQRQLAIMQAALGNAAVLLWITQLTGAGYIDPAHPDTITGVQAMVAADLITAEEAAALLA